MWGHIIHYWGNGMVKFQHIAEASIKARVLGCHPNGDPYSNIFRNLRGKMQSPIYSRILIKDGADMA